MRRIHRHIGRAVCHPQTYAMQFAVENLIDEIASLCFTCAEAYEASMSNGGEGVGTPQTTLTKDIIEDEHHTVLMATLNRLMTECMMMLRPYTKTPLERRYSTDDPKEAAAYVIWLTFENPREQVQVDNMAVMVHDYVVKRVCYEWLSLTLPNALKQIQYMLEESEKAKGEVKFSLAQPVDARAQRVKAWGF